MALSRIWSAFILIAIFVAIFHFINGDTNILNRMVTGKADDVYETRYFSIMGYDEPNLKYNKDQIKEYLSGYGYVIADSIHAPEIVISNQKVSKSNNPFVKIVTFEQLQKTLVKHVDGVIETCKVAVNICIGLIGIMALFMGFMSIAEKAGGIRLLSKIIAPFFSKLFPELPKGHPAFGHMMLNFSANLLGLDNAATPFGLKAMESLQEVNKNKSEASNAQIMFLSLHASGLTIIPVSIIAARSALKSNNPTEIFIPCLIATFIATIAAMSIVAFKQKINVFQPIILAWIGSLSALIALMMVYIKTLDAIGMQSFSSWLSNGIILLIFLLIVLGGWYKKIDVFDAFVSGAKGGFETAVKVIPYLVGMLVAISLLRTSGCFEIMIQGFKSVFSFVGVDTRFVDGLPTALIKPLSGSGARGMMIDTMKTYGPDSFSGRLACILQGSSDTTFYVVAVYFGSVAIKNTRYAIQSMLLADLVGIITSILLCYWFFGNA